MQGTGQNRKKKDNYSPGWIAAIVVPCDASFRVLFAVEQLPYCFAYFAEQKTPFLAIGSA